MKTSILPTSPRTKLVHTFSRTCSSINISSEWSIKTLKPVKRPETKNCQNHAFVRAKRNWFGLILIFNVCHECIFVKFLWLNLKKETECLKLCQSYILQLTNRFLTVNFFLCFVLEIFCNLHLFYIKLIKEDTLLMQLNIII